MTFVWYLLVYSTHWKGDFEALRVSKGAEDVPLDDVTPYVDLVQELALQLSRRLPNTVQIDDLISDGFIGLMSAGRSFDPNRKVPFRSYACIRIRGAMLDGLRARDVIQRRARKRGATTPIIRTLSAEMEESLDRDNLRPDRASIPRLLSPLPQTYRLVLHLYYLESLSMLQIGGILGITEGRVSQLRRRAIGRIQKQQRDDVIRPTDCRRAMAGVRFVRRRLPPSVASGRHGAD